MAWTQLTPHRALLGKTGVCVSSSLELNSSLTYSCVVLGPDSHRRAEASGPRLHGCPAKFLLLDMENWKLDCPPDLYLPNVALPTWPRARLDTQRYGAISYPRVFHGPCLTAKLDPREAAGHCASVLGSSQLFDGKHPSTATGGVSPNYHSVFPPISSIDR